MKIETRYPLLAHNTFGMDVKAARFVEYDSEEELCDFLKAEKVHLHPFLHIGGGSNLLFKGDYDGLILHSAIRGREVVAETADYVDVRVGAGEVWDDFVAYTVGQGWYGAENLSLIPGEVGASAVQNIGAYGVEVKDLIVSVDTIEVATAEKRVFPTEECRYAYRESIFKNELKGRYIVTYVTYRLSKLPVFHLDYGNIRAELEKMQCPLSLQTVRDVVIAIRKSKLPDPAELGNAGSFFMNPIVSRNKFEELLKEYPSMPHYIVDENRVKIPAGWMIDQCGWKGKALGRAAVHDKQALVLVNLGGATGAEVMHLAEEVVRSVRDRFGIEIHPEVNYI
ncbi:UDP-N-acetylmuramate dehydrogenase [uncultured Bacteroides sp.]|uniref:UDP-N-acetylmuramate dehydrogenase n=1 Tax=uncultured Bacteroides sp. TaxID=162156 RepID=UPI00260FB53A|nr:UDP-N-acetylmuramate dehydrogenase [uncultured Bacteroides sp.]